MKKLEIKNSNIKGGFTYQNGLKTTAVEAVTKENGYNVSKVLVKL